MTWIKLRESIEETDEMTDGFPNVCVSINSGWIVRELDNALSRLDNKVLNLLDQVVESISEIAHWDVYRRQAMKDLSKEHLFGVTSGLPFSPPYSITLCTEDLLGHSDEFVRGTVVHELAHAFTLANGGTKAFPCDSADEVAISWGFDKEIKEQQGCREVCPH